MASGFTQEVVGEIAVPGVVAQVVDSHYASGGNTSQCDSNIMVRWRSAPHGRIRAWSEGLSPTMVGQMMLLPARSEHHAVACDGPVNTRSLALSINPAWFEDAVGTTAERFVGPDLTRYEFKDFNIEQAMRRIFAEVLSPGPLAQTIIRSCGTLIAADLASRVGDAAKTRSCETRSELRTRQIEEFIQNYGSGWPSQLEIAESLGIGVGHMRQVYRRCTGRNLFGYMEEVRMIRARSLLADCSVPLKVIAHRLGFSTPSAFSSAFRRGSGTTPREYRTLVLEQALQAGAMRH